MTIHCTQAEKETLMDLIAHSENNECILSKCPCMEMECRECLETYIKWVIEG